MRCAWRHDLVQLAVHVPAALSRFVLPDSYLPSFRLVALKWPGGGLIHCITQGGASPLRRQLKGCKDLPAGAWGHLEPRSRFVKLMQKRQTLPLLGEPQCLNVADDMVGGTLDMFGVFVEIAQHN